MITLVDEAVRSKIGIPPAGTRRHMGPAKVQPPPVDQKVRTVKRLFDEAIEGACPGGRKALQLLMPQVLRVVGK